jgi:KRAB domain-containing zinc finger protein
MHQRKEQLKPYKTQCPVCQEKFSALGHLKEHLMSTYLTAVEEGELTCRLEGCSRTFPRLQPRLKLLFHHHVLYDHFGERYRFRCDLCDFQAVTASKLRQHLMSHEKERPFACPTCPQAFRTRPKLRDHVRIVHEREKSLTCSECQATFARGRDLRKHHAARHAKIVHPCDRCGKTFSCAQTLRVHQRNAHSERPQLICHRCALDAGTCKCSASGQAAAAANKEDLVQCPLCEKRLFARRMAGHLHYHRQSSLRPYICQQCSKTFTHAASLKRHALLHVGVKQFTCEQCGKQFYQKAAYETHCRSHTEERLACRGCGRLFLTQYLLNFHCKAKRLCRAAYEK